MLTYEKRNITTVSQGIIIHGCNAQGVMGSGVAKAIRDKWPGIFKPYKAMCDSVGDKSTIVGNCSVYYVEDQPIAIVNAITQQHYGSDGKIYASVEAIDEALFAACMVATYKPLREYNSTIYLPKIGCGLGGLDWNKDVKPIVEQYAEEYPSCNFMVCEV